MQVCLLWSNFAMFLMHTGLETTIGNYKLFVVFVMKEKKVYTPEQLKWILSWYRERWDQLPETLELNKGVRSKNLRMTVDAYQEMIDLNGANPTYTPQINHLFQFRAKLIELGYFTE